MIPNKEKYRSFCENIDAMSIFSQPWWLDAVAGSNWDVIIEEKGGQIIAALPYEKAQKKGFDFLRNPILTQHQYLYVEPSKSTRYAKILAHQKKIITSLLGKLPKFAVFKLNIHPSFTNWLPFYWLGFEQSTRYTYIIDNLSEVEKVYSNFESKIKTDIKKAEKLVEVEEARDVELLYQVVEKSFERQGIKTPFSLETVQRIEQACSARNCSKVLLAKDEQGNVHAGIYLIWDKERMYYLLGGGDPNYRNSGATSLLLWHAIQFAATQVKVFDFEGSMMEPVERFVRSFGAVQQPFFTISKVNSRLLKLLIFLKNWLK